MSTEISRRITPKAILLSHLSQGILLGESAIFYSPTRRVPSEINDFGYKQRCVCGAGVVCGTRKLRSVKRGSGFFYYVLMRFEELWEDWIADAILDDPHRLLETKRRMVPLTLYFHRISSLTWSNRYRSWCEESVTALELDVYSLLLIPVCLSPTHSSLRDECQ